MGKLFSYKMFHFWWIIFIDPARGDRIRRSQKSVRYSIQNEYVELDKIGQYTSVYENKQIEREIIQWRLLKTFGLIIMSEVFN